MIATHPQDCLSDRDLHDFSSGRLPADRFERLLHHLDVCDRCQQRIESAAHESDSFVVALAARPDAPESNDPILTEPDCQAALFKVTRSQPMQWDTVLPPIETLGPYRLLRPLGRGGMGAVYLAEHQRLRKKFAIKLLPRERGFNADWLQRFEREMQAVASLAHRGIVTATDAGEVDGWHYLVMEYLDGLDLAAVVRQLGPLPVDVTAAIMRDVCTALAAIHEAGLVHRDIKPSNVMLTRDGSVKLLDLGLVFDGRQSEADMRLTTVGHVIGTLAFAAPEQLSDSQSVDARADLYGVGATLFQLIAGTPAHTSNRGIAPLVIEKTSKPARHLRSLRADCPEPIDQLVSRLLERDPAARPSDAAAVAKELEPYATSSSLRPIAVRALRESERADSSTAAPAIGWTNKSGSRPRRTWTTMWMLAGGLAAVMLAATVFYLQTDRGTLVIDSPIENLTVSILRDGQAVDALEVVTGENRTVLRSGRYQIQLDAASDGIAISESEVVVRRGAETVVKIRQQPDDRLPVATSSPVKLYKGKPMDHWVALMKVERDVDTLADAMAATASLADAEDVEAAHSLLIAARRLGGWILSSAENRSQPPSERFMDHFNREFARLMPTPGIAAITRELPAGNERSRAACLWSLLNFNRKSTELFTWASEASHHVQANSLHQQLQALLRHPNQLEQQLTLPAVRKLSLILALAAGSPLADEPGLVEELRREAEQAAGDKPLQERIAEGFRHNLSQLRFKPSLAPEQVIAASKLEIPLPAVLAVPSLLSQEDVFRESRNEIYLRKLQQQPAEYADETLLWLGTTPVSGSMMASADPGGLIMRNEALWKESLPIVAQQTTHPELLVNLLGRIAPAQEGAFSGAGGMGGFGHQISAKTYALIKEAIATAQSRIEQANADPTAESSND